MRSRPPAVLKDISIRAACLFQGISQLGHLLEGALVVDRTSKTGDSGPRWTSRECPESTTWNITMSSDSEIPSQVQLAATHVAIEPVVLDDVTLAAMPRRTAIQTFSTESSTAFGASNVPPIFARSSASFAEIAASLFSV
jgi:hypothetical protein